MRPAFTLADPHSGTDYRIYTVAETGAAASPVPAVLFLDGDDQFDAAVKGYRRERETGHVPPLLLVGVGYGASYTKPANKRVRDYTPTALATETGSGGGDAFLAFLTNTLWPELTRRHALREDVRGLAGHSLGSLLAVYALLQKPGLTPADRPFFNRILASAPSLWWDDRSILKIAEEARRDRGSIPAHLYLCVGEEDTPSMTGDLALFQQQLAAAPFPGLRVTSQRFPGRNHYNVLETAFAAGLRALFATDQGQ